MIFGGKFSKAEKNIIQDTHLHSSMLMSRCCEDCYRMWIAQNKIPMYFNGRDDQWKQFVSSQSNGIDIYDRTRGNIADISEQQWKDFIYYFKFFIMHCDYLIENRSSWYGIAIVTDMKKLRNDAEKSVSILMEKYKKCHKGKTLDVEVSPCGGIRDPFDSYIERSVDLPFYELEITNMLINDWEKISSKLDLKIKTIASVSAPQMVEEYSVDGAYEWCSRLEQSTMRELKYTMEQSEKSDKWTSHNQYLEFIKYYYENGQQSLRNCRREGQFLSWEYGSLTLREFVSTICAFEYQKCALNNSALKKDQGSYLNSLTTALKVLERMYYEMGL